MLCKIQDPLENTSGKCLPSQLRAGTCYSYGARRLALASEHLLANGWNVDLHPSYPSPLAPLLSKMPEHQLKALSGNGMNLQTLAAWFVYAGMSVKRKEGDKLREEHRLLEAVLKKDSDGEASDDDDAADATAPQDEDGEDREEEKKETDHEEAPEEEEEEEEQSDD